jgi:hypothetical protein
MGLGNAFWASLESSVVFKEKDQHLLKSIFNPFLSDRRNEGDRFTPPDASYSHVEKLRALIKEEENVRQLRKEAFCGKGFKLEEPGNLFPLSWSSKLEVMHGKTKVVQPGGLPEHRALSTLVETPEQKAHVAAKLHHILKAAAPEFDKRTEDGMRFRIYRWGSLEVRTTQEHNCEEAVGVVFILRSAEVRKCSDQDQLQPQEKITKATEYVEHKVLPGASMGSSYFLVLDTEKGHQICTERLADGQVMWEVNPENLEERTSLAKVFREKECSKGAIVRDIQKRVASASLSQKVSCSPSVCKLWTRSTFMRLTGKPKKEEDPVIAGRRRCMTGNNADQVDSADSADHSLTMKLGLPA